MSYVSLENSESFLKCFEVMAEDKSSIVSESVLYLQGKTGKGFFTVAGVAGIEVFGLNVQTLTEDFVLHFQPSRGESTYLLSFEEIDNMGADPEGAAAGGSIISGRFESTVTISDLVQGKEIAYPKETGIRGLIVRIRRSGLENLIQDFDAGTIESILGTTGNDHSLSWPITFKYRLLLEDFMAEIVQHPFRELFAIRNISILVEYLLQQFFVMNKLNGDGNALSVQDTYSLSRVEHYLCLHYKTEFPGI